MTELSPAAQAVLDAAFSAYWSAEQEAPNDEGMIAAAALRAAVKFTKKQKITKTLGVTMAKSHPYCLERDLLAIADELEGAN